MDIVERGNSVEIDLPRGGELVLENVFLSDLDDDDFIFHGDARIRTRILIQTLTPILNRRLRATPTRVACTARPETTT